MGEIHCICYLVLCRTHRIGLPAEKIRVLDSFGSALQAAFMIAPEAKLFEKNNLEIDFVLAAGESVTVTVLLS
jgi:hypothetical protein